MVRRWIWAFDAEIRRFGARRMVRWLVASSILLCLFAVVVSVSRGSALHYREVLPETFSGAGRILILVAVGMGASAVAAEWNTGSMALTVTFDPSRVRVLVTKVVAAGLGMAAVTLILFTGFAAVLAGGSILNGSFEHQPEWVTLYPEEPAASGTGPDAGPAAASGRERIDVNEAEPFVPEILSIVGRVTLAVAIAATFGAAVGVMLRRTAAVIAGILVLYLVGEAAITALFGVAQFWGPASSLVATGTGEPQLVVLEEVAGPYVLYAALWTVGAIAAATAWFARTEVATGSR